MRAWCVCRVTVDGPLGAFPTNRRRPSSPLVCHSRRTEGPMVAAWQARTYDDAMQRARGPAAAPAPDGSVGRVQWWTHLLTPAEPVLLPAAPTLPRPGAARDRAPSRTALHSTGGSVGGGGSPPAAAWFSSGHRGPGAVVAFSPLPRAPLDAARPPADNGVEAVAPLVAAAWADSYLPMHPSSIGTDVDRLGPAVRWPPTPEPEVRHLVVSANHAATV